MTEAVNDSNDGTAALRSVSTASDTAASLPGPACKISASNALITLRLSIVAQHTGSPGTCIGACAPTACVIAECCPACALQCDSQASQAGRKDRNASAKIASATHQRRRRAVGFTERTPLTLMSGS